MVTSKAYEILKKDAYNLNRDISASWGEEGIEKVRKNLNISTGLMNIQNEYIIHFEKLSDKEKSDLYKLITIISLQQKNQLESSRLIQKHNKIAKEITEKNIEDKLK